MTNITLTVTGAKALAQVDGTLTSGMVGIPITITYDEAWNGLTKNLVCRCSRLGPDCGDTRTVLNIEDSATVAHEVMQSGNTLYLGVEGYKADGSLVIPTKWADCGYIHPGASVNADSSADPMLPVWAQLQSDISQLKLNSVNEEDIDTAVADYLTRNPVEVPDNPLYVRLPTDESGSPVFGTAGMYAVSDGAGGITWAAAGNTGGDTGITTHGIIWDLVNVISSNPIASVSDGAALVAVLTAADGYTLGDVTVTMGGEVVTGCWNADTATVTIASVTGDVMIACAGVEDSTETVDTSPVIAQTGYCYRATSTTAPNVTLTANDNYCVTDVYAFHPDVDAIEAHSSYDASLGYINAVGGMAFIKHFVPNTTFLENGGTDTNGTYKKAAYFVDGVLEPTLVGNLTSQSTEGSMEIASKNALQKTVNGVAFTLYQADIDNSYAYWSKNGYVNAVLPLGVNDGDIIFAGKNTQYYGMTNISGQTPDTSETVNEAALMTASFDNVYIDTGEYSEEMQPKWGGSFVFHRGHSSAPDNTLQAIWETKKHGYNCCEVDVRYSSDGIPVLCHDPTVTGTVDGEEVTYTIAETTAAVLKTVCVGNTAFPDAKVCTLEDTMRLCRAIGMRLDLDIKVVSEQMYADCLALARQYGMQDEVLFCCYGMEYAQQIKTAYSKASLRIAAADVSEDTTLDQYLTEPGNLYFYCQSTYCGRTDGSNLSGNTDHEAIIPALKARGYKMLVWDVTPYLLPDVMQWEPDLLMPQSAKDGNDWYALIRELHSFDGLVW